MYRTVKFIVIKKFRIDAVTESNSGSGNMPLISPDSGICSWAPGEVSRACHQSFFSRFCIILRSSVWALDDLRRHTSVLKRGLLTAGKVFRSPSIIVLVNETIWQNSDTGRLWQGRRMQVVLKNRNFWLIFRFINSIQFMSLIQTTRVHI